MNLVRAFYLLFRAFQDQSLSHKLKDLILIMNQWFVIALVMILLLFANPALADDCSDEEEKALEKAQQLVNEIETEPQQIAQLIQETQQQEFENSMATLEQKIQTEMQNYQEMINQLLMKLDAASECDSQLDDVKDALERMEELQKEIEEILY